MLSNQHSYYSKFDNNIIFIVSSINKDFIPTLNEGFESDGIKWETGAL